MRAALASAQSPMDYNLQAALPGVHGRLASNENATRQLIEEVGRLPTITIMEASFRQLLMSVASSVALSVASALGATQPSQPSILPTNTTNAPQAMNQNASAIDHVLTSRHDNVRGIYDEWFGQGEYDGVPIPGGIQACETKFGTKWRGKNTANRISRQNRVCKALQEEIGKGKTLGDVCRVWDAIYIDRCQRNLAKFVKELQGGGDIRTLANRGKGSK